EGFDMFATMMDGIKEETVGFLFNLDVQVEEAPAPVAAAPSGVPLPQAESQVEIRAKGLAGGRQQPRALQYTSPTVDGEAGTSGVVRAQTQGPGRVPRDRWSGRPYPPTRGAGSPAAGRTPSGAPGGRGRRPPRRR